MSVVSFALAVVFIVRLFTSHVIFEYGFHFLFFLDGFRRWWWWGTWLFCSFFFGIFSPHCFISFKDEFASFALSPNAFLRAWKLLSSSTQALSWPTSWHTGTTSAVILKLHAPHWQWLEQKIVAQLFFYSRSLGLYSNANNQLFYKQVNSVQHKQTKPTVRTNTTDDALYTPGSRRRPVSIDRTTTVFTSIMFSRTRFTNHDFLILYFSDHKVHLKSSKWLFF